MRPRSGTKHRLHDGRSAATPAPRPRCMTQGDGDCLFCASGDRDRTHPLFPPEGNGDRSSLFPAWVLCTGFTLSGPNPGPSECRWFKDAGCGPGGNYCGFTTPMLDRDSGPQWPGQGRRNGLPTCARWMDWQERWRGREPIVSSCAALGARRRDGGGLPCCGPREVVRDGNGAVPGLGWWKGGLWFEDAPESEAWGD